MGGAVERGWSFQLLDFSCLVGVSNGRGRGYGGVGVSQMIDSCPSGVDGAVAKGVEPPNFLFSRWMGVSYGSGRGSGGMGVSPAD